MVAADAPPKLRLLARGLAVFGSYAKVLLEDDEAPRRTPSSARCPRTRARSDPGPVPASAVRTAARGDHVHRHDRRRSRPRAGRDAGRGGLRRPGRTRVRRGRDIPAGRRRSPTRPAPPSRRSGRGWASPSPPRTSASRSCGASSREDGWRRVDQPGAPRDPLLLVVVVASGCRAAGPVRSAPAASGAAADRAPRHDRSHREPSAPACPPTSGRGARRLGSPRPRPTSPSRTRR